MAGEEITGAVVTTENAAPAAEQTTPSIEPATVFGFAPEDSGPEVAVQEQNQEQPAPQGNEKPGVTGEDAAPEFPDERTHKAFEAQRKRYQREMESLRADPAMEVGEQLIRDVMRQDGCSREDAVGKIRQRFIDAYAKRENVGQDAARRLMRMQLEEERQQTPEEPSPEERAHAIVDELVSMETPQGFDMDAAVNDQAFVDLLSKYPPEAAVRIYAAEQRANQAPQQVADMLRARQSVPASTRPQQSVMPEPNFSGMSSEDFFAYKERAQKSIY